ncbi:anaerobic DMSO reductase DmsABC, chain C, anchor subunit [Campylobacter blaseri]|uniref:Dimethyl sulfoxide reductase n=1 Tax=Campylobacter blaseri TaxID=2042961 RepID=A0A2P8R3A7_9BACT|nr:DmsC/YnfH family molybdoenzyme membrane anchor subunit [Campylobacter blaseri]PSM52980.1 dimethyl sulfoxide reductase [Campylobacter blaseri]PSM54447.1 dimethyl sulfoxide reductase [Campylobacter blaseri]QKF85309.1 anaerobic DMSO reductase DmsABC, chain C, anchor subunit [Campylobacter blaseri]
MTFFEMVGHELPLVLFTVLAQAVVGMIFVYTPAYLNGYKDESDLKFFGIFTAIAFAIAMLPSVFHLGDITHALNFIRRMGIFYANNEWHIGWMNNEVAAGGLTMLFAFVLFLKPKKIFLFITLIFGLLCIFFMVGAYGTMQKTVTTWRFDVTFFYFFSSMLFLGGFMYHLFFAKDEHEEKMAFLVGLFGSGILMTSIIFQTLHLGSTTVAGTTDPFELLGGRYGDYILYGTGFIGAGIMIWYLNNYLRNKSKFIATIALLCALAGVLFTRAIFYGMINTNVMH